MISEDGGRAWNISEGHPILSSDYDIEPYLPGDNLLTQKIQRSMESSDRSHIVTSNMYSSLGRSTDPSNPGESSLSHQGVTTGESSMSCSECGKSFTHKGDFAKHQRIHTGERPYSCSECGKSYIHKGTLETSSPHEGDHRGDNLFSCSECGKCFPRKGKLIQHQRVHTSE
ncbi:hypothetical protein AB205_0039860, partial [Aquarana catesbeiana]